MAASDIMEGTQFLHVEYDPYTNSQTSADHSLTCGEQSSSSVDIIFVQGLASRYSRTWSVDDQDEPDGRYHWLKAKLPQHLPQARILAFEYDSEWYQDPSIVDIGDCAQWLLDCIVQDRRHHGDGRICPVHRKKPLILVGHSFGGLVIKQALILAGSATYFDDERSQIEHANHTDLLASIAGICFLGTPHRGSNFASMASWKMTFGSMLFGTQIHPELVHMLMPDNHVLRFLHKQFIKLLRGPLSRTHLVCFYETQNVSMPPRLVVDMPSATLDQAINIPLEANHMQLNKFHKGDDKNYDLFVGKLTDMVRGSTDLVSQRLSSHQYNDVSASFDLQNLKRWLKPSGEAQDFSHRTRLQEWKKAPETCAWANELQVMVRWIEGDEHELPLWIHGQAGAGKSVLCSFLIEKLMSEKAKTIEKLPDKIDAQSHAPDQCMTRSSVSVLYFLNGIDREHGRPWNFLGTLIHQLLLLNPQNEAMLKVAIGAAKAHEKYSNASTHDVEVLRSVFEKLLSFQERIYILIDGLEENDELRECLEQVSFLKDHRNVRLAFFSQDVTEVYAPLSDEFPNLVELSIREHTGRDIERFAELKANNLVKTRDDLAAELDLICEKLQSTANGNFQWVNESITHLASAAVNSANLAAYLKDMPIGLHSSYEKVFARIARQPPAVQTRVQIALRWLAVSGRPMTARELRTAIEFESQPTHARDSIDTILDRYTQSSPTDQSIVDELYDLVGSLIQVGRSKSRGYYVTLSHPSLRVAITGRHVTETAPANGMLQFTEASAHGKCAQICMKICAETALRFASCGNQSLPPMVEYAWAFWAYHLDLSELSVSDVNVRFDQMVLGVCRDTTIILNALVDFAALHLVELRLLSQNVRTTMAIKMAQESLGPAVETVTAASTATDYTSSLQAARKTADAELIKRPRTTALAEPLEGSRFSRLISRMKKKFVQQDSATLRLEVDTVCDQRPELKRNRPYEARNLTKAAQSLRLVTLRFAVNPVAKTLKSKIDAPSLSVIHCLARVANLFEECGNYPYWNLLPASLVYTRRFTVPDSDPFFGPAKYVLQSLEETENKAKVFWTDDGGKLLERQSSEIAKVAEAHETHVDKINEMPASAHIVAQFGHLLFGTTFWTNDDFSLQENFVEPMKTAHVRASLLLTNFSGEVRDAGAVLRSYTPEILLKDEYRAWVASIPQVLKLIYIQYMVELFSFASNWTKTALAAHITALKTCFTDLDTITSAVSTIRAADNIIRPIHLVTGLLAFLFRFKFMPWWDITYTIVTWRDIWLGLRHPAAFLSIDGGVGIWWLMYAVYFKPLVLELLVLIPLGLFPKYEELLGTRRGMHILQTMTAFHLFLLAERICFRMSHALVSAVATGRVMFSSAESVGGVVVFSYTFWIIQCWNLLANTGRIALSQGLGLEGIWYFVLSVVQVVSVVLLAVYVGSVTSLLWKLMYPLLLPWWLLVRVWLLPWVSIFRVLGATTFVCMAGLAVLFMRQYWTDPYGMQHSLKALQAAKQRLGQELAPYQILDLQSIGQGHVESQSAKKPRAVLQRPSKSNAASTSASTGSALEGSIKRQTTLINIGTTTANPEHRTQQVRFEMPADKEDAFGPKPGTTVVAATH